MASVGKYIRQVRSIADEFGWTLVFKPRGGHALLVKDGLPKVSVSLTPKNRDHAIKNVRTDIERMEGLR